MKKWMVLPLLAVLLLMPVRTVYAAKQTVEIELTEACDDCIFSIVWEHEEQTAEVTVTSPDGRTFGTTLTPLQTSVSEGAVYINVGDAAAGIWQVTITGEKLGRVDIDAGELPGNMNIDSFHVERWEDRFCADWSVSDCREDLKIRIFAASDKNGSGAREVKSLNAAPQGGTEFDVTGLENGSCYFYIRVSDDSGAFSIAYADETFDYEDPGSAEALTGVRAFLVNDSIYIAWDGETDQVKLMLFDPNSGELLREEVTGESSGVLAFPQGMDKVLAGAAVYDGRRLGKYDKIPVEKGTFFEASVTYPDLDATNESGIPVQVTAEEGARISAVLNDRLYLEDETDQGEYRVNLKEGENSIVFIVTGAAGNMRTFPKEIYYDRTPPQLAVTSDVDKTKTDSDHVYLEGYTEAGASLTCNGEPVELQGSYFQIRCPLKPGKNTLELKAFDIAGNESLYMAAVERTVWTARQWYAIIAIAAALLLAVIYTVKFIRLKRERTQAR